jgi:hypothetical protein
MVVIHVERDVRTGRPTTQSAATALRGQHLVVFLECEPVFALQVAPPISETLTA